MPTPNHRSEKDETTILKFRRLLERQQLAQVLFDETTAQLAEQGLLLRQGTVVDATLIAAPPSTKNRDRKRDPDMTSTKKGNNYHFGMKAHIAVDADSGLCIPWPSPPPRSPTGP